MKYLLLIYEKESVYADMSEAEQGKLFGEYMQLTSDLGAAGKLLGGDPLQPVATASTVRVRNGKSLVTDGPFAEAKEQLGGYYLVDAENLDDALAIAARIPGARYGGVEVRPVQPIPDR
jgi:hypothetical protein